MQISYTQPTSFGKNPFKVRPAKLNSKVLNLKEELIEDRLYKTYTTKKTNKLVKTILYDYNNKPRYVTDFENGLPKEQFIYGYPYKSGQLACYRPFYNGISGPLFDYNKKGILNLE